MPMRKSPSQFWQFLSGETPIKWVEIAIPAECLYQHLLLTAEKKFWVASRVAPRLFGAEHPLADHVRDGKRQADRKSLETPLCASGARFAPARDFTRHSH